MAPGMTTSSPGCVTSLAYSGSVTASYVGFSLAGKR